MTSAAASAISIVQQLLAEGAQVRAFDPQAMEKASPLIPQATLVDRAEEVADGADALLLLTEWPEFRQLPWLVLRKAMLSPLLFDGRNLLDPAEMRAFGFTYFSVGR